MDLIYSPPAPPRVHREGRGGPSSQKMRAREIQWTLLVAIVCDAEKVKCTFAREPVFSVCLCLRRRRHSLAMPPEFEGERDVLWAMRAAGQPRWSRPAAQMAKCAGKSRCAVPSGCAGSSRANGSTTSQRVPRSLTPVLTIRAARFVQAEARLGAGLPRPAPAH